MGHAFAPLRGGAGGEGRMSETLFRISLGGLYEHDARAAREFYAKLESGLKR